MLEVLAVATVLVPMLEWLLRPDAETELELVPDDPVTPLSVPDPFTIPVVSEDIVIELESDWPLLADVKPLEEALLPSFERLDIV